MNKKALITTIVAGAIAVVPATGVFAATPSQASTGYSTGGTLDLSKITISQPPVGFDPSTASLEELKKYGLPEKPTNPGELKEWQEAMVHAKHFIYPTFVLSNKQHRIQQKTVTTYTSGYTSGNWSGYLAFAPSYNFTKISGDWIVPDVTSSTQDSYSCSWVGIGGWGSGTGLIQAGTESDATTHLLTPTSGKYYPWWEMLPDYPTQVNITDFGISPGDKMYTHITYDNSGPGSVSFDVEDLTTGAYTSFVASDASADYYGQTAEWVVERTEINGSLPSLADFVSDAFSNSYAGTSTLSQSAGSWNADQLQMIDTSNNNTLLAHPGTLDSTGTSFTEYWDNYK